VVSPDARPAWPPSAAWTPGLLVVALAALVCALVLAVPSDPFSDVLHYKYWTHQIATYGVSGSYSGTYPETAAIYPPVTMYGYRVAGWLYRHLYDSSFDMEVALQSQALAVLIRLVAVVPHLATSLAIYLLLLRRFGVRPALLACAAFALNPAAIFDAAYWGQPDMVHALFLLVAIYCFEEDRPLAGYVGYACIGLACATKPQAWALLPFLGYVSLRRFGLVTSVKGGVVATLAGLATCIPYIAYGTFREIFILPGLIAETMPVVTANAHNIWWLVTNAKPDFVFDSEPLIGPLTYRQGATALTLVVMAYGLWRTNPRGRDGYLSGMAAYIAFAWFMVTTRAHENHDMFVLPLLVMATPRSRMAWGVFAALTATLLLNMALHDFGLSDLRAALLPPETWTRIQLANAAANVVVLLAWSVSVWPRARSAESRNAVSRAA
jgi:Gpi18-like mannosyltransferase